MTYDQILLLERWFFVGVLPWGVLTAISIAVRQRAEAKPSETLPPWAHAIKSFGDVSIALLLFLFSLFFIFHVGLMAAKAASHFSRTVSILALFSPIIAYAMYFIRNTVRCLYAVIEFGVGLVLTENAANTDSFNLPSAMALCGGIYVIIRAFDNFEAGLDDLSRWFPRLTKALALISGMLRSPGMVPKTREHEASRPQQ